MSDASLSHVDDSGAVRMVDVGSKPLLRRRAVAEALVDMRPETARALRALPKGDALATAQVAGIMAAKRTAELIPLCHPLPLTFVDVRVVVDAAAGTVTLDAEARTSDRTGVEMEAMTAASVAALTVYDMVKGVERGVTVGEVALLEKTGGKQDWRGA